MTNTTSSSPTAQGPTGQHAQLISAIAPRCLVFVGMMGCGKTAIGRMTANALGLPFIDSDQQVEEAAGMSVADIFETLGEQAFRDGEQKVICRILKEGQAVLALGGGAFANETIREEVTRQALAIWLEADIDTLLTRVMKKPDKRPLLQTGDPKVILQTLLEQRTPHYRQAHVKVSSSKNSKAETRDRVIGALRGHLNLK